MSSSLLIILLVVVWLLVLLPMVVNTKEPIRRTSSAFSATRVLHRGDDKRLKPRRHISPRPVDDPEGDEEATAEETPTREEKTPRRSVRKRAKRLTVDSAVISADSTTTDETVESPERTSTMAAKTSPEVIQATLPFADEIFGPDARTVVSDAPTEEIVITSELLHESLDNYEVEVETAEVMDAEVVSDEEIVSDEGTAGVTDTSVPADIADLTDTSKMKGTEEAAEAEVEPEAVDIDDVVDAGDGVDGEEEPETVDAEGDVDGAGNAGEVEIDTDDIADSEDDAAEDSVDDVSDTAADRAEDVADDPDVDIAETEFAANTSEGATSTEGNTSPVARLSGSLAAKISGFTKKDRNIPEPAPQLTLTADDIAEAERRRGRGGYDPVAAEAAAQKRYKRRRIIFLVLAVLLIPMIAVAAVLGGLVWIAPAAWCGVIAFYLAALRSQVRLENELRQRRLAQMRRARAQRAERGYREEEETPAPSFQGQYSLVDVDDGDPLFDHLDTRPFMEEYMATHAEEFSYDDGGYPRDRFGRVRITASRYPDTATHGEPEYTYEQAEESYHYDDPYAVGEYSGGRSVDYWKPREAADNVVRFDLSRRGGYRDVG